MCYQCDDVEYQVPCPTDECSGDCGPFVCKDCSVNTLHINEYYMVTDQVWKLTGLRGYDGMLCIGCLEQRLGRMLNARDFTDAPINQVADMTDDASARLLNRLRNYQVHITR